MGVFLSNRVKAQETIVFLDGQNIYHLLKEAWSFLHTESTANPYSYPSFDVEKLSKLLVNRIPGRNLKEIRFYTGVPEPWRGDKERFWHKFWSNKIASLRSKGIFVYRGKVNQGGQEKGVDVNISIDLVELTYDKKYDVAIIVSQDWDFGGAIKMAKKIANNQKRTIEVESAFPYNSTTSRSDRGIPGTTWVKILKADYDTCIDPHDYR